MRVGIIAAVASLLMSVASLTSTSVSAQTLPGPSGQSQPNQARDCQTVRTCNFARGATVRGCLSSYTCRTCRLVTSNCTVGGGQGGVCQRMRCSWGA